MGAAVKIYIAMKYTSGDNFENVKAAVDIAEKIAARGHHPYVPHLSAFWNLIYQHDYDFWMTLDRQFMLCCDAMYFSGQAGGAHDECKEFQALSRPIYNRIEQVPDCSEERNGHQT